MTLTATMTLDEDIDLVKHAEVSYTHTEINYSTGGFFPLVQHLPREFGSDYRLVMTVNLDVTPRPELFDEIDIEIEVGG